MTYKLTYFDVQGRGEPIRFLLAYGGADFDDIRISAEAWRTLKPETPFGSLPLLEHDGKTSHQSIAICRYLAKQFKLVGENDWEDLEIDAAVDTITDLFLKLTRGISGGKSTIQEQFQLEDYKIFLKKLDEQIKKNNGYLAANRFTWADLYAGAFLIRHKQFLADFPNLEGNITRTENLPKIKEFTSKHSAKK